MSSPSPDTLAAEFDALMTRAGHTIPADRRDGMLAGFVDLRQQAALLHARLDSTDEPSNIFSLKMLEG